MNNISPSHTNSLSTVLVSGGSIAGPTVAYWLNQYGFKVTLVERNNGTRTGGQAIDIRAVALNVVDKMGVLADIRAHKTDIRGASSVDADGVETSRSTTVTFTGGLIDNDDVEILRDDLGEILYEATSSDVEYLFGNSVTSLTETADGVDVSFEHGPDRRFDLVIGADGLHSRVRKLTFGPEPDYVFPVQLTEGQTRYLGIFSVPNFLELDRWEIARLTGEAMCLLYVARNNTVSRAMIGFTGPSLDYDYRDRDQQKQILADQFSQDNKRIMPQLLEAMWTADDFYFDSLSQTRMPKWSAGRVALVGDAAYCPSAMSGQGTSVALVGAYVLAGEIAAASGNFSASFENYEREIRDFAEANQQIPFIPREQKFGDAQSMDNASLGTNNQDFLQIVNGYTLKDYSAFLPETAKA